MLEGQRVSVITCLTFCCRALLSGCCFSVSFIQWFPEKREVHNAFFIGVLPTQQTVTISAGALTMPFGLAISGKFDKLRSRCCKAIVAGASTAPFPATHFSVGEQLRDVVLFYDLYFLPSFSCSALSIFAPG